MAIGTNCFEGEDNANDKNGRRWIIWARLLVFYSSVCDFCWLENHHHHGHIIYSTTFSICVFVQSNVQAVRRDYFVLITITAMVASKGIRWYITGENSQQKNKQKYKLFFTSSTPNLNTNTIILQYDKNDSVQKDGKNHNVTLLLLENTRYVYCTKLKGYR